MAGHGSVWIGKGFSSASGKHLVRLQNALMLAWRGNAVIGMAKPGTARRGKSTQGFLFSKGKNNGNQG